MSNLIFGHLFEIHLIAVSYDRYDSIVKSPLTNNGTFTKCTVAVIVLIWLISIGFSIGPFLKWGRVCLQPRGVFLPIRLDVTVKWIEQSNGPRIISCAMPFLVIVLLNWSVFKTAKRQANAVVIQIGSFDGSESQQQDNSRRMLVERKAALDVSIIIAAFLLCFLSTWIVGFSLRFFKSTNVPPEAVLVTYCIFTFSSVCNPIIYSIRKRDFRRAVKKGFLRTQIAPQTNPSD